MKKLIISFVVFLVAICSSNAQVFVGGSLGVGLSGGKDTYAGKSVDLPKSTLFTLSPKVGYYVNDDFAIGLNVTFLSASEKSSKEYTGYADDRKSSVLGWGIGGFARYNILELNKFSVLLEGSLGVSGAKSKVKQGSTTVDGDPTFTFAIDVVPVLSYSLTEKWSIEASCDFLRLGFESVTEKDASDKKNKTTENSFGLLVNAGTNSIISDILSVGLIFKF